MNIPVSLTISLSAALIGSVSKKSFTMRSTENSFSRYLFALGSSLVAVVSLLILSKDLSISWFTALLGIMFGVITTLQTVFILKAYETGSFSYTSVIVSLSMLLPALSGAVLWSERIGWAQIVGIALMVGCFCLSTDCTEEKGKSSLKWLLYCLFAFLCTGVIGIMQKWHQNTVYKGETDTFLVIAFAVSVVYSTCACLLCKEKQLLPHEENETVPKYRYVVMLALLVVCGVGMALNNQLNLVLSGKMDSAVFFPIVNGGGLILTTLASVFIFREKLTAKHWIGLITGSVAVIFLCNPFA